MLILSILCLLVLFGAVYTVLACWCLRRRIRMPNPSIKSIADSTPGISILKPLCGDEDGLFENLSSYCDQDYPEYEMLLGVGSADDPAIRTVEKLQRHSCGMPIRLLVAPPLGANPKSAILDHLVREARFETQVISDSDIRVQKDYLRRVVRPLADPNVGLVTTLYRMDVKGRGLGANLNALYSNATFAPAVALASFLPDAPVAMGATTALRRGDLQRAGGFATIADHLADDRQLAILIRRLGLQTVVSDVVVSHRGEPRHLQELWCQEIRRARTLAAVEPRRYLLLPLTFMVPWACALVIAGGAAPWCCIMLAATLALRLGTAGMNLGELGARTRTTWLLMLPLRDLLDGVIWFTAVLGRRITWRGRSYELRRDGTLIGLETTDNLGRRLIRRLDARLRRSEGIFEFCDDPRCIFRIEWKTMHQDLTLRDGTALHRGQRYAELHLWNEHLPAARPDRGPDLGWAKRSVLRAEVSLRLLARFLNSRPDLADIRAIHGRSVLAQGGAHFVRVVETLGFEFCGPCERAASLAERLHQTGENMLIWGLTWTFNPRSRQRGFSRERAHLWMSRDALSARDRLTAEKVAS